MLDALLKETDLAKHLKVSIACVRRWRLEQRGPRYLKIGSLVRYRSEDVEHWLLSHPTSGDSSQTNEPKVMPNKQAVA